MYYHLTTRFIFYHKKLIFENLESPFILVYSKNEKKKHFMTPYLEN